MIRHEDMVRFAEFCMVIHQEYPDIPMSLEQKAYMLSELFELSTKITRYAIKDCNEGLSDTQRNVLVRYKNRAQAIADELGLSLKHMSDARGFALKFVLPSGRYNSMGGTEEGWGI